MKNNIKIIKKIPTQLIHYEILKYKKIIFYLFYTFLKDPKILIVYKRHTIYLLNV